MNRYIVATNFEDNPKDWIFDRVHHYYMGKQYSDPSEILSEIYDVQYSLLMQSKVPVELLSELAKSSDAIIQCAVLHNISVTPDIIDYIADNSELDEVVDSRWPETTIRREIATHSKSSGYALEQISDTYDYLVLSNIADHSNALPETLDYLVDVTDSASSYGSRAYKRINNIKYDIIDNPNTSIDTLEKLSEDSDDDISQCAIDELQNRGVEI